MNKENLLLKYLDNLFAAKNKLKSSYRKVGQTFDEKTNEHVIQIEYRVRTSGGKVEKEDRHGGDYIRAVLKKAQALKKGQIPPHS